jgi:hypothetical protein
MGATVRAAAAQLAPVLWDRDATMEKVCRAIREAGANGAQLVAFPETIIPGYPYWLRYMDPFSARQRFFPKYFKEAVEIPSRPIDALSARASIGRPDSAPSGRFGISHWKSIRRGTFLRSLVRQVRQTLRSIPPWRRTRMSQYLPGHSRRTR